MDPSNGLDLSNPLNKEVLFLVAQFLSGTPCQKAAKALVKELEEHELIPPRVNWLGVTTSQDFTSFAGQFNHIGPHHLPKLLEGLVNRQRQKTSISISKSLLSRDSIKEKRRLSLFSTLNDQRIGVVRANHNVIQPDFFERLQFSCGTLGHLSAVYCVLFDITGKYIFTGADDSLVKIWSAIDGRLLATLRGASSEISDLAVNNENTLLAAGSCDKLIRIWCLRTCAPVTVLNVHSGSVTSIFFCPIPRSRHPVAYLASTSTDGSCSFWGFTENPETGQVEFQPRPTHYQERMRPGHAQMICSSFSSGGIFMAAGSADNNVRVYNMLGQDGPERILEVEVHSDRVDSISWAHEGLRFISGSKDGTALVWRFENSEWRYVRLLCSKLPGSNVVIQEDPRRRPRVTMVGWNTDDTLVLTAVSDHLVKVWNPKNGELIRILEAHTDEAYVIESHPFNPRIICTAGHDGRIIVWDIGTLSKKDKGEKILEHYNKLDQGQGHGAVFDCKWAPDGLSIAATDSHGHLLIFTTQSKENSKFSRLPKELFFHTDYRPLTRDAITNEVLDEQTQVPPHLMPPPFLVDMEGNPYPPALQKLVPGRERCREDQLIPNVAVGNGGFQEVIEGLPSNVIHNPRSNIDEMIEQLALEQGVDPENQNNMVPVPRLSGGPNDRERRVVGLRRSGDVEGVRQSRGNWQRGNYGFPERKVIMPLNKACLGRSEETRLGYAEAEESYYKENSSRRPTSATSSPEENITGVITSREARSRRIRRLPLEAAERRQRQADMFEIEGVARPNPRPQQEISVNQQATRRAVPINNRGAVPLSRPGRPNPRPRGSRYNIRRVLDDRGVHNESDIENMEMPSDEDTSDEEVSISNSSSSSSDSDSESDWGGAPRDSESRNKKPVAEGSRKSTRKSNAASPQNDDSHQEDGSDDEPKPGPSSAATAPQPGPSSSRQESKSKPKKAKGKKVPEGTSGLDEIPPEFRPSEWLAEMYPKRTPYFPQVGDEVVYYRQGHEAYVNQVEKQKVYEISRKTRKNLPYVIYPDLEADVPAIVQGVKFDLIPPRVIILKLSVTDRDTGEDTGIHFNVTYHDMTNIVDFVILRQIHDKYIRQNWNVGDRFRCLIDRSWWVGTIDSIRPKDKKFPNSKFLCYNVIWDNTETEKLSPWDMDIITDSFAVPADKGKAVPASEEDLRCGLYEASPVDWPPYGHQDAQCAKLSRLVQQVMDLAVSEAFLTPVDINMYPEYAFSIAYPIDLSTIKARLDSRFYRRAETVRFDARYIKLNAIEFNQETSDIVKNAKIVSELLLELIENPDQTDVNEVYHRIVGRHSKEVQNKTLANKSDGKPSPSSSRSSASTSQPQPSTSRRSLRLKKGESAEEDDDRDWRDRCKDLLNTIFATQDAVPFRAPVDPEQYPDYYQHIDTPMDLHSVREDLQGGNYSSPLDFHKDMNLIFSNSRQYNTDKRSQIYSMTIRLQSMYECQVKPILTSYRSKKRGSASSPKKRIMPSRASSTASTPRKNPMRNAAARNPYLHPENGASTDEEAEASRRYTTRASHHNDSEPGPSSGEYPRRLRRRTGTTATTSSSTNRSSVNGHSSRNGLSPPLSSRKTRRVKRFRISSGESLHSRSNGRASGTGHYSTRGSSSGNVAGASLGSLRSSRAYANEGSDEFEEDDVEMPQLHHNDSDDEYDSNFDQETSRSSLRRSSRVKKQNRCSYYDSDDYSYSTRYRGKNQTNYDETQNGSSGEEGSQFRRKRKRINSSHSADTPPRKLQRNESSPRKKNVLHDDDEEEDDEEEDEVQPGPSRRAIEIGCRRSTRLSRNNEEEEESEDGDGDEDDEEEEAASSAEEYDEEEENESHRRSSSRLRRKPSRHSYSDEDANSSPPRSRRGQMDFNNRRTRGVARPDYAEDSDSEHDVSVSSRGRVRRKRSFLG